MYNATTDCEFLINDAVDQLFNETDIVARGYDKGLHFVWVIDFGRLQRFDFDLEETFSDCWDSRGEFHYTDNHHTLVTMDGVPVMDEDGELI